METAQEIIDSDEFKQKRTLFRINAALILHLKYQWSIDDSVSYSEALCTYFDDPECWNEDGEPMTAAEAIECDKDYWEA